MRCCRLCSLSHFGHPSPLRCAPLLRSRSARWRTACGGCARAPLARSRTPTWSCAARLFLSPAATTSWSRPSSSASTRRTASGCRTSRRRATQRAAAAEQTVGACMRTLVARRGPLPPTRALARPSWARPAPLSLLRAPCGGAAAARPRRPLVEHVSSARVQLPRPTHPPAPRCASRAAAPRPLQRPDHSDAPSRAAVHAVRAFG